VAAERTSAKPELILASASVGRARLLRDAGIRFRQQPAHIDERALEAEAMMSGDCDPRALAERLASAKATAVSADHPGALVIGADQVMDCGGQRYNKPPTIEAAREQLLELRGRTHRLSAALCVAENGKVRWRHVASADLTMREFSPEFLDAYMHAEGDAMLASVGAYRIEGPGIQLFSAVKGDHSTIIGLPLLPLLGYLREIGWLAA
jgi:septum formation protein